MSIKNPLRYPGAKSKLYDYICKLLIAEQRTGCTFTNHSLAVLHIIATFGKPSYQQGCS